MPSRILSRADFLDLNMPTDFVILSCHCQYAAYNLYRTRLSVFLNISSICPRRASRWLAAVSATPERALFTLSMRLAIGSGTASAKDAPAAKDIPAPNEVVEVPPVSRLPAEYIMESRKLRSDIVPR